MFFNSYTIELPSIEFIECLTDLDARVTHYKDWEISRQKHPRLIELGLLLTEIHTGMLQNHIFETPMFNGSR